MPGESDDVHEQPFLEADTPSVAPPARDYTDQVLALDEPDDIVEPIPAPKSPAAPIAGGERRVALDVLRGVALFGILCVNIQSFAMITSARRNPIFGGGEGELNHAVWTLTMMLADTKFIALFSMMFGAGAVVMCKRWTLAGETPIWLYYRRMIVLAWIGLLHGFLLWDGDILFFYGAYGLVLYPFMSLRGSWLVVLGIAAAFANGFWFGWPQTPQHIGRGMIEYQFLTAGWKEQFDWRKLETAWAFKQNVRYFALQGIGYMLIGMGLVKGGVITGHRSRWTYLVLAVAGFGLGIPISGYLTEWYRNFDDHRGAMFVLGSFLTAFGWMGAVMALAVYAPRLFLTQGLANVGRMALTNYLMQTVICTTIFFGHGFGKFATVSRVDQAKIVLAICVGQMIVSTVWLQIFRFGPVEWAWRTLTYLRLQPMLRRSG